MPQPIRIEITSDAKTQGFDEAIQRIEQLKRALHGITVPKELRDLAAAIRAINNAGKGTQSRATQAMAEEAEKAARSLGTVAVAMQRAKRAGTDMVSAMMNTRIQMRQLDQTQKQLKESARYLEGAQDRLIAIQKRGAASVRELVEAQHQLFRAQQNNEKASRNLQALDQQIQRSLDRRKRAAEELKRLEEEIATREQGGEKVPSQLRGTASLLRSQIEEFDRTVAPQISELQKTIARMRMTSGGLRGRIAQINFYKTGVQEYLADLRRQETEQRRVQRQLATLAAQEAAMQRRINRRIAREFEQQQREAARAAQQAQKVALKSVQQQAEQLIGVVNRLRHAFDSLFSTINRLAAVLRNTLSSALRSASTMIGNLTHSAASRFASMRHALDSTGRSALIFGRNVSQGMNQARTALERTAAGWSLILGGQMIGRTGRSLLSGVGIDLGQYMEYERVATRAAISGSADLDLINTLVFGLQRGQLFGTDITAFGRKTGPIKQFSAQEIAQGAYYLVSALGLNLQGPTPAATAENLLAAANMLMPMLQVAAFTLTSPETMIKGALNIGMEFGYDPRQIAQSQLFGKIAAAVGYLANISTMEVPDIVESFKYIGPMFHGLQGGAPGAGLADAMAAIFFASEVGLRGGNVGRGLAQFAATMRDPSGPALEAFSKAFGQEASPDAWKQFWFDARGNLKGGFYGFISTLLAAGDRSAVDTLITEIFTQNASRALIGITSGLGGEKEYLEFLKELTSGNYTKAIELWERANRQTSNTVFASWQNLKNAWFELSNSIITSIRGPLIRAFDGFAKAIRSISDILKTNPVITRFITDIVFLVGVLLTAIGALLTFAGTVLIIQRAILLAHGSLQIFSSILLALPHILGAALPVLLALGSAAVLLYTAWHENFLGIRDTVNVFVSDFDNALTTKILPVIAQVITHVKRFGTAFAEFIRGILLGIGPTNNLGAALIQVFGLELGGRLYARLLQAQRALYTLRQSALDFFRSLRSGIPAVGNITSVIQEFITQVVLGFSNLSSVPYIGRGLTKLADAIRQALTVVINTLFVSFKSIPFDTIFANLDRAFSSRSLENFVRLFESFASGAVYGFVTAVRGAGEAIAFLTRAIADTAQGFGRWRVQLLGITVTLNNVAQLIGVAFGALLATRLLMSLRIMQSLTIAGLKLSLIIAQVGVTVAGAAAQFVLFAARIAVVTATLLAQAAAFAAGVASRLAFFAAEQLIQFAAQTTTASLMAQSAAHGAATAATVAQTAATAGLAATLSSLALSLASVLVPLLAIPLAIGAFVALGLVAVGMTKGWSAALEGLIAFLQGLWDVLSVVLQAVTVVVSGFLSFISVIASALGVTNEFYLLGVALGLALTALGLVITGVLVAAFAALTASILSAVAAFVAMNLPTIALVGAILAIGQAIAMLLGFDNVFEMLASGFKYVADAAVWAANKIEAAVRVIKNALSTSQKEALEFRIMSLRESRDRMVQEPPSELNENWRREAEMKYPGSAQQRRAYIEQERNKYMRQQYETWVASQGGYQRVLVSGPEGPRYVLMDPLEKAEYDLKQYELRQQEASKAQKSTSLATSDQGFPKRQSAIQMVEDLLRKWGIDISLYKAILSGKRPDQLLGLDQVKAISSAYSVDQFAFLPPEMQDFITKAQKYNEWKKFVDRVGIRQATLFYEANDIPIPQPPSYEDLMGAVDAYGEMANEIDRAAQELAEFNQQADEALSKAPDIVKAFSTAFDQGKPGFYSDIAGQYLPGFMSIPTALAKYGDTIIKNAENRYQELYGSTELPRWFNLYEGIMDTVGYRMMAKDNTVVPTDYYNVYGKNLHRLLANSPGFQNWAQEIGLSVDDLLKDVPKFVHAEELVPLASSEIAKTISLIPVEMYQKLDHLGVAEGWSEFGIEWLDLAQYAISQASAGHDWNLANYIAESWGVSVQEAEQFLLQHGINPNIITQALFPNLDLAIASQGGKVNVFDEAWYEWFKAKTKDGVNHIIEVSQQEFSRIPDAVKYTLSQMDYTFVITNQSIEGNVIATADAVNKAFKEKYGKPILSTVKYVTDEFNNTWVEFKNKAGETVRVSPLEYEEYLNSLRTLQAHWKEAREEYERYRQTFENPFLPQREPKGGRPGRGDSQGRRLNPRHGKTPMSFEEWYWRHYGGEEPPEGEKPPALFPPPDVAYKEGQRAIEAWTKGFESGAQSGESIVHMSKVIDLERVRQVGRNAAQVFIEEFNSSLMSATGRSQSSSGQIYSDATASPFDETFRAYAQLAVKAFSETLRSEFANLNLASLLSGGDNNGQDAYAGDAGGPFDLSFSAYAALAFTAFKETLQNEFSNNLSKLLSTETSPFDSAFKTYGESAASVFMQAFNDAIKNFVPSASLGNAGGSVTAAESNLIGPMPAAPAVPQMPALSYQVKLTLDDAAFYEKLNIAYLNLLVFDAKTYTTKLDVNDEDFLNKYNPIIVALNNDFTPAWTTTLKAENNEALVAIGDVLAKLGEVAATWTATVSVSGADEAARSVGNLIGLLNILDAMNVTANVNVVHTTTYAQVGTPGGGADGNPYTPMASGGLVTQSGFFLVGERGPELVSLPRGARVYSHQETVSMMSSLRWTTSASAAGSSAPPVNVVFNGDIHVQKEQDIDTLVRKIDEALGKRQRSARRVAPSDYSIPSLS